MWFVVKVGVNIGVGFINVVIYCWYDFVDDL